MSLVLLKSVSAMMPGFSTSVLASGGTEPYVYSVVAGGAGGTIDPDTGEYTAPATVNFDPAKSFDTIQVTDDDLNTATGAILIATPFGLVAEIIQREMDIDPDHIYYWDQKIFQPKDSDLYVALSIERCKPLANVNTYFGGTEDDDTTSDSRQGLSMQATIGIDIISRSMEAFYRKEEVLLALNSNYARFQQSANGFQIAQLPANGTFLNLSVLDGAAIPYRFHFSINILYVFKKTTSVPYFDNFEEPEVTVNA